MEWKDVLRGLLDKHQITAAELSRRSGVSQGSISRYLSSKRTRVAYPELIKIADALGEPVPGGAATVAAEAQRNPEADEFVREWQGLPEEGRAVTWEVVRVLGTLAGKKKQRTRKPVVDIPFVDAVYEQRG